MIPPAAAGLSLVADGVAEGAARRRLTPQEVALLGQSLRDGPAIGTLPLRAAMKPSLATS